MRITGVAIKNVGICEDVSFKVDKPLICFYGEVRQGKTTILNAIKWVLGAKTPDDIIRHGQKEAEIVITTDRGSASRSWYRGKGGETKARAVQFIVDNMPVKSAAKELKALLNPFLLDNEHLLNMNETERKKFFMEICPADTSTIDTHTAELQEAARDLRAKIKAYGEIDLTPVEAVDVSQLKAELFKAKHAHGEERQTAIDKIAEANAEHTKAVEDVREKNASSARVEESRTILINLIMDTRTDVNTLKEELKAAEAKLAASEKELAEIPEAPDTIPDPERPDVSALTAIVESTADTADLDQQIENAGAQNVRHEQYLANVKRDEQRAEDEKALADNKSLQEKLKAQKITALKEASDQLGVEGLEFDDAGNMTFDGTQAGMLSTSQVIELSSKLSKLFPEGFGLELLDRAESLGRSIFEYVDRAKERGTTILASIVGEQPSDVPDDVGVFVVEDGRLSE